MHPCDARIGATAQPQTSQSTVLYQISLPQSLDMETTGEIAENWKLWKEKYNNYFVISRLDRESHEYQLVMFKHAIGDNGLKLIKTFSYSKGENANDWHIVMGRMEKHCIRKVIEIFNLKDIVSIKGTNFLQKRLTISSLS